MRAGTTLLRVLRGNCADCAIAQWKGMGKSHPRALLRGCVFPLRARAIDERLIARSRNRTASCPIARTTVRTARAMHSTATTLS